MDRPGSERGAVVMRLFGAVLLVAATGMLGVLVGWWYAQRVRHLHDLTLAFHVLETEIAYGAAPLPAALRRAGEAVDGWVRLLFFEASSRLETQPGLSGSDAWAFAVQTVGTRLALTLDERASLRAAGIRLGISHTDDQVRYLRAARHTFRRQAERAEGQRDVGVRLWRYVGVSAGLVTVLLLY